MAPFWVRHVWLLHLQVYELKNALAGEQMDLARLKAAHSLIALPETMTWSGARLLAAPAVTELPVQPPSTGTLVQQVWSL